MLERAPSPYGPWSALGKVFPSDKAASWYSAEQADPYIFFYKNKPYLAIAGWGGPSFKVGDGEQVVGIVELDPKTYHAKQMATRLIRTAPPSGSRFMDQYSRQPLPRTSWSTSCKYASQSCRKRPNLRSNLLLSSKLLRGR